MIYRLNECCNVAWKSPANPRGWHPLIAAGDFAGFITAGTSPGLGLWLQGLGGLCDPYVIGTFQGRQTVCAYAPAWETVIPSDILRKTTNALRTQGLASVAYGGTVRPGTLPTKTIVRTRVTAVDDLLSPILKAGFDQIGFDACAGVGNPAGTDAMLVAERAMALGLRVIVEPHAPVDPSVYPWFDGRFGVVSAFWTAWQYGEAGRSPPPQSEAYFSRYCPGVAREHIAMANLTVPASDRMALLAATGHSAVVETYGLDLPGAPAT